jgi:hypothetical protein
MSAKEERRKMRKGAALLVNVLRHLEDWMNRAVGAFLLAVFLLSAVTCLAFDPNDVCVKYKCDPVPCIQGKCGGWRIVSVARGMNNYTFQCFNETGQAAFRVTCRINLYDSFGAQVGAVQQTEAGPISRYVVFSRPLSDEVFKMDGEIYYATEPFDYGRDGQTREDGQGFVGRSQ